MPSNAVSQPFRCGMIAIIGRPNVGKSTLMNGLIEEKLSITSKKAQTTRHRIMGIYTDNSAQFIFVDTPGYQLRYTQALNRSLNKAATSSFNEVDLIVWVVDAMQWTQADKALHKLLPSTIPVILVANKVDMIHGANRDAIILDRLQFLSQQGAFAEIIPMSAENDKHVKKLRTLLKRYLPEGEAIFDEDTLTDKSTRFWVTECIREKIFRLTGDEVPYQATVIIDQFIESPGLMKIAASIVVDNDGQKAILIGKQGQKLKQIGTEARIDLQHRLDQRVHLTLWVKVREKWADNMDSIKSYGYE